MMIFTTPAAAHLIKATGDAEFGRFADGEIRVKVRSSVSGKEVALVASLAPPTDNIMEAALLLDALHRAGAGVRLVITYFGYARQDRVALPGDSVAAAVVAKLFSSAEHIDVIDCHSKRVQDFLTYDNHIPYEVFFPLLEKVKDPVVVAPDKGASTRAACLADMLSCDVASFSKTRPKMDQAAVQDLSGDVKGKNCIIFDDLISTGRTVMDAAAHLKKAGAKDIIVAATHGVFSGDARKDLEKSPIKAVYVTDTLPVKAAGKIKVIPMGDYVKDVMKKME